MKFLLVLFAVLLAGCTTKPTTPGVTVVAPTGPATAAELSSLRASNDELKKQVQDLETLAQRAAGGVYGVQNANVHNPDGLPKEAVAAQAEEAASALPGPTAEQKLAKEKENSRILAGELAAVKAEMGQAISENQALKAATAARDARIAELEREVASTKAAGEKERAEAADKLQARINKLNSAIAEQTRRADEAEDKARKAALQKLGWVLLGLGAAFTIAGAAIAFLTKGVEWQRAAIAAGAGALCFGLYWTINQWWFKWAVIGSLVALLAAAVWWFIREMQAGRRQLEADEAEDTLMRIITEFDAAKADMTLEELKARLGRKMSDAHKALIHELRAEAKRLAA